MFRFAGSIAAGLILLGTAASGHADDKNDRGPKSSGDERRPRVRLGGTSVTVIDDPAAVDDVISRARQAREQREQQPKPEPAQQIVETKREAAAAHETRQAAKQELRQQLRQTLKTEKREQRIERRKGELRTPGRKRPLQ